MNSISKRIICEAAAFSEGQSIGFLLIIINVLLITLLQVVNIETPVLLKTSIIILLGGLMILKVRPRW